MLNTYMMILDFYTLRDVTKFVASIVKSLFCMSNEISRDIILS